MADEPNVPLLDVGRGNAPLRQEMLAAIGEVIDSGRFLYGPDVSALENEIATLSQVDHAIGCASGSDALLLALMALDIGPGDEVIVPSFTFFASVSCIERLGAKPVFVDILPDTFNINHRAIEAAITPATRAIIPVHLFGQCAAIDKICQIGEKHGIAIIEDAAQAIASAYHSRPAGSWGRIGCFSFYPTKNLGGMGDGGMMTTNDPQIADRLRLLSSHGMRPRYHHRALGINSRLDTFQAAVLRVKLKHLPEATVSRQKNATRYRDMLQAADLHKHFTLPKLDPNAYHVWNQYSIRVPDGQRDAVREHLASHGVGSEIYYPVPMHQQECFAHVAVQPGSLPETERAAKEILNLPIFPELQESEQERVVSVLRGFFQGRQKAAA
ncbi:Aminotransferase [Rosistilla carotiformis]|uniref:Aminotransferase n=1 Tax=Rosistilla carotiformis TaxID=2528017 RepID=A0A518JWM6_9BACT|nr:DegT/DnrJ/EryC1/StrS family aminotransferase [Rosistilla carotiformis]QDV69944.1 Aminotransferase [Rosistilla carotiformis]